MTLSHATRDRARQLYQMTWPMLIGVLSLMSFQLADSFFIARLGTDPLAVVGFTIPIYQLIIGVQVGIGIATTALISQLIGAQQSGKANELATHILLFGSISILLLCFAIWFGREQIIGLLGGEPYLLKYVDQFWQIWLISAFVGAILYFGYSICRAHGDTKLPGTLMVLTSLINIGLDPLFIFYFELGLEGAAYATLLSFALGCFIIFPKIIASHWLSYRGALSSLNRSILKISKIAGPAMTSQLLPALSAMLATAIVADFGTEAVAAWGLGVRVEFFCLVLILALTMSLPPMIGRHYGANNLNEVKALISLSVKSIILIQSLIAILIFLFSEPISHLLAPQPEVALMVNTLLMIMPLSYGPLGICMVMVSVSNAISQPMSALFISFARLFICYIPCLWLGALFGDFNGLLFGALVGNVIAGLQAYRIFHSNFKLIETRHKKTALA